MDTSFIKGIIVPILTPVDQDENVDEARLRRQVGFVIDNGVSLLSGRFRYRSWCTRNFGLWQQW